MMYVHPFPHFSGNVAKDCSIYEVLKIGFQKLLTY